MPAQPREDEARNTLTAHAAAKGTEIYEKYGPRIGWEELARVLGDRECVRYPCEIAFDASGLEHGEFAHPEPKGEKPEDGFVMRVHPHFRDQLDQVPLLVLYQLVLVNYGVFAGSEDAEAFGASALGLPREEYYTRVCALADQLAGLA